ncbi:MAG TPA: efflux RND transporter periplasmic adaptor subunit [Bacilli bacterium]|nr:efflux RND transporter periplasmic adaptor subunit [Bacilli bacterium]
MNNFRRLLLVNILVLVILIGGGFLGYYFYNQSTLYIKTENATVSGQQVTLVATATGQLDEWNGAQGKSFKAGDAVGSIMTVDATGKPAAVAVTAPQDLTVVQSSAVENSFVAPGTPLAYAYDLDHLWVTANINETDIQDVKVGQDVDIYVDAYPSTTLSGKVASVGLATANTFSLLPTSNTTGNYTKVTQVIPVKVTLDGYKGLALVPGMNVEVRVHR